MSLTPEKLVVIAGPTAVGKTRTAVEIARRFSGEVISCDSMQVYRGLDIGSAKATKEEMQGVPHHMLDILEPEEPFSAADFQKKASLVLRDIQSRGKLPVLCGGTGFYIQALIYGTAFSEEPEDDSSVKAGFDGSIRRSPPWLARTVTVCICVSKVVGLKIEGCCPVSAVGRKRI